MKLKNLIEQHQKNTSKHELKNNFGDAYLLNHNPIYNQVRQAAIEHRYQYDGTYNEAYSVLPLSQLDELLNKKKIPYQNNVAVLLEIEKHTPNQIEWDHICDNLKQNHVFHESCHGIARSLSQELNLPTKLQNQKQTQIALMLLEESFANACELIAVKDVHDATHRIFFETNSYICMFEDKTHLKNAYNEFGEKHFLKFVILCYFHANFLNDKFSDQQFNHCLDLAFGADQKLSPKSLKTLKSLAKNAFALNHRFRFATTGFYLRMNGISQPVTEALRFDHLKVLENSSELKKLLEQLSDFSLVT